MESNVEDQNTAPAAEETAAPRRRASRRVSAAAGATSDAAVTVTATEAPAASPAAEAPATEAPATEAPAAEAAPAEAPAEAAPKKRATRSRKKVEEAPAEAEAPAAETSAAEAPSAEAALAEAPAEAAPKKRATRSRKKAEEAPAEAEAPAAEAPAADAPAADAAEETPAAPAKRTRSRRAKTETAAPAESTEAPAGDASAAGEAEAAAETRAPAQRGRGRAAAQASNAADAAEAEAPAAEAETVAAPSEAKTENQDGDTAEGEKPSRNRRGRGRGQKGESAEQNDSAEAHAEGDDSNKGRGQNQGQQNQQGQGGERGGQAKNGADQSARSSRTRQRDRKRRGAGDELELEITEDDVLLPIAGILDVLDNYAFVRTSGYLPGTSDVYVSLGQVKKYGLRRGDAVVGAIRQPREGESGSRQKYNAIVKIDSVNGRTLEENEKRADVAELTPVYPETRLRLERAGDALLGRSVDLAAPLGLGQRALVVLPPHADGTAIVTELAESVSATTPDAHLMVVLADAHPEDVTHLERTVRGEVVAATFDRTAEDQATIAELAIERAKRMLELGHDVVVLLDSLNSFARAYAQAQHAQARPAHDELDEFALGQIKKLLAGARNVENGGSLTLLATVHRGTKIAADETLLREARRVANSEIRIKKTRAGLAAAVDITDSRTSRTAAILSEDEARVLESLRAALHDDDDAEKKLVSRMRETASNAALLAEIQRTGKLS